MSRSNNHFYFNICEKCNFLRKPCWMHEAWNFGPHKGFHYGGNWHYIKPEREILGRRNWKRRKRYPGPGYHGHNPPRDAVKEWKGQYRMQAKQEMLRNPEEPMIRSWVRWMRGKKYDWW